MDESQTQDGEEPPRKQRLKVQCIDSKAPAIQPVVTNQVRTEIVYRARKMTPLSTLVGVYRRSAQEIFTICMSAWNRTDKREPENPWKEAA